MQSNPPSCLPSSPSSCVKTAEPIGPKFCVGPHMNQRKVFGTSKLKIVGKFSFENENPLKFEYD